MQTRENGLSLEDLADARGFTPDELARWGITVEGDVVYIPTVYGSGTWGRRTYDPNRKAKYLPEHAGMGNHLYNPLGLGPNAREVWLAEGEFDTLSLVSVGAPAVGVLGASSFNRRWALLYQGASVVVAFDPDAESAEQAQRVAKVMDLFPTVKRFDPLVEGGYDDLNDWFKADRVGFKSAVAAWTSQTT